MLRDPTLAAAYEQNFESRLAASEPLDQYGAEHQRYVSVLLRESKATAKCDFRRMYGCLHRAGLIFVLHLYRGTHLQMSIFQDSKDTIARFGQHTEGFQALYTKHQMSFGSLNDVWTLLKKVTIDSRFHSDFKDLGQSILKQEGGKMSLTALFIVIGVSVGGIGIAGMGSAIGLPAAGLVAVLGSLGFLSGQEIDSAIGSGSPERKVEAAFTSATTAQAQAAKQRDPLTVSATLMAPADTTLFALTDALKSIQGQLENVPHAFDRVTASISDMHNALGSLIYNGNARIMDTTSARISDATERLEKQELQTRQLKTAVVLLCGVSTLLLISVSFLAWELNTKNFSLLVHH